MTILAAVPIAVSLDWQTPPARGVRGDVMSALVHRLAPKGKGSSGLRVLDVQPLPAAADRSDATAPVALTAGLTSAPAPAVAPAVAPSAPAAGVTAPRAAAASVAPSASAPFGPAELHDVPYANQSAHQVLDFYRPASNAPAPLVVYVHGGGWVGGDKGEPDEMIVINALVGRGYAVASINYRLADEGIFPTQLDDTYTAVTWLHDHGTSLGVDTSRIALFGVSAGAQLAVLLSVSHHVDGLRAVVDWEGPTEIAAIGVDLGRDARCAGFPSPDDPESFWAAYVGGPVSSVPERVAETDPRSFLTAGASGLPRFLVAHGDYDCIVPVQQSERFVEALQATGLGSLVTFRVLRGAGHGSQFPIASEAQAAGDFLAGAFA